MLRLPLHLVSTAGVRLRFLVAILSVGGAFAQQYEAGGFVGYGIYRDASVTSAGGTATAGIRSRVAAGAVISEDLYSHVSGEVRYVYQGGDPFLSVGGVRGNIPGQSHALQYDFLVHLQDRDRRLRPFVAVGVGGKYYWDGAAPVPQPFPKIATLVKGGDWQVLGTVGVGLKYRLRNHLVVRGDFRDEITPFPTKLLAPAGKGTSQGLFQQFTPMFGLGYWF
jgi:hypothetical protein